MDFTKIIEMDDKDHTPLMERAFAKEKMKDFSGAIADYSAFIALIPEYNAAYYNRGIAYLRKGDKKKALLDWKKASSLGLQAADEMIKKYGK